MELHLYQTTVSSPIGDLALIVDDFGAVVRIAFLQVTTTDELHESPLLNGREIRFEDKPCAEAKRQLEAYFQGERRAFELDLAPEGTPFQQRVWRELLKVPFGETVTYGELADRLDSPGASRAVGHANHVNPIPIVIPCHRVIGQGGALVGFGGGLPIKRALLDHERGQSVLWS